MNNLIQNKLQQLHEWRIKLCLERDKNYSFQISSDIVQIDELSSFPSLSQIVVFEEKAWLLDVEHLLVEFSNTYSHLC